MSKLVLARIMPPGGSRPTSHASPFKSSQHRLTPHPSLLTCAMLFIALSGCSGPKPILYPNDHLKAVGKDTAERDIADCRKLAEEAGATPEAGRGGQVAGSTAGGAAVGAAGGAVGGAVVGAAGRGSAIGAAAGATAGLLRGLFRRPKVSDAYKRVVDRCLAERGYEPMGWE